MKHYRLSSRCVFQFAFALVIALLVIVNHGKSYAAIYYVDGRVASSGNGLTWATAWKALSNTTGLSAGDTVYISGGSSYATSGWNPASGTAGNPITYKIGQEAGHNGTATFTGSTLPTSPYIVISGDAGDGNSHFVATGMSIESNNNIRISYIAFGDVNTLISLGGAYTGIEIDHCTATAYNDRLAYWEVTGGNAYGLNSVHDNVFALSYHPGAGKVWEGADGFQGNLSYTDFYNNYIYGVADGRGVNHGDAWQSSSGGGGTRYVRIYNNRIRDIGNYHLYMESYSGNLVEHIRVYNNIFENTDPNILLGSPQQIAIGGSYGNLVYNDFIIANNLFADNGTRGSAVNWNATATYTSCYYYNNIVLNANADNLSTSITKSNNVRVALTSNSGHFVSYTPLSKSNDFRLAATDTTFRNQGKDLSSFFSTDKDGNTRSGAWDIGPFISSGDLSSPAPPSRLRIQ